MAISVDRYLVLFLLAVGAGTSYIVGFMVGFWAIIALGAVFELAFWCELFLRRRR